MRGQHDAAVRVPSMRRNPMRRATAREVMKVTLGRMPEPDADAPTIIVDGDNANIRVLNGHLQIDDRSKERPRSIRLSRPHSKGKRIVVLAWHGMLTFDAIQWCQALDIQLMLIDPRMENIILHGGKAYDDPRLRRAQVLASVNASGLEVTRYLLSLKLRGQRANLAHLGYISPDVDRACEIIDQAGTLDACRQIESSTAQSYWECLSQTVCTFRAPDRRRVPAHWSEPGSRYARKTRSPRNAVTPFNALLNYLYKLAEAETRVALRAVGLDPGLGIVHTDRPGRDSMALDVLEAIRPDIERYMLQFVEERVFSKQDFIELLDGTCRLLPPLTHELAQTVSLWRSALAPVVEHVANLLRPATRTGRKVIRTQLTNANIKASLVEMRKQRIGSPSPSVPADGSVPSTWSEILPVVQSASTESLVAATGLTHRYVRRVKRGERTPRMEHWSKLYQAASNATMPVVPNSGRMPTSWSAILQHVQRAPTARLAEATGLTDSYIRKIKRGELQPAAHHWRPLYQTAQLLTSHAPR